MEILNEKINTNTKSTTVKRKNKKIKPLDIIGTCSDNKYKTQIEKIIRET